MRALRRGALEWAASRGLAAIVTLAVAAACGGEAADDAVDGAVGSETPADTPVVTAAAADRACAPVEPDLGAEASLSGMPGSYRLTLATAGSPPASAEGTLVLEPLPAALQEMGGAATPLSGTTDIEVEAVGALRLGDLGSADPAAPGVLVIESGGPSIMLRLGSEVNRRDQVAFDAGYTVLTVHHIAADGFDGSWRSGSRAGVNEGYFCARRSDG